MNSESVTTCTRPTQAQVRQNPDGEEGEMGTKSHLRQEDTGKNQSFGLLLIFII